MQTPLESPQPRGFDGGPCAPSHAPQLHGLSQGGGFDGSAHDTFSKGATSPPVDDAEDGEEVLEGAASREPEVLDAEAPAPVRSVWPPQPAKTAIINARTVGRRATLLLMRRTDSARTRFLHACEHGTFHKGFEDLRGLGLMLWAIK